MPRAPFERRGRLEAQCAALLQLAPERFAAVMNALRPAQYIRRRMTVEKARYLLDTLTAVELADMVETAFEMTPIKLDAGERFTNLWQVEVDGYTSMTPSEDRVIRGAQEARRWLSKKRGRPPKSDGTP